MQLLLESLNQKMLAVTDGVFCEPASAASIAGVIKYKNKIKKGAIIVSVLTGQGLKDPSRAIEVSETPTVIENSEAAVIQAIAPLLEA